MLTITFFGRKYLNSLIDSLHNVYSNKKIIKELWESIDRKYKPRILGLRSLL